MTGDQRPVGACGGERESAEIGLGCDLAVSLCRPCALVCASHCHVPFAWHVPAGGRLAPVTTSALGKLSPLHVWVSVRQVSVLLALWAVLFVWVAAGATRTASSFLRRCCNPSSPSGPEAGANLPSGRGSCRGGSRGVIMPYFVGGGRQRWSHEPPEGGPQVGPRTPPPTLVAVPRVLFFLSKGEAGAHLLLHP